MPTRKTLLRIMLWSLAAAAVLGVPAILTGQVECLRRDRSYDTMASR
jgi:hypothetical protein